MIFTLLLPVAVGITAVGCFVVEDLILSAVALILSTAGMLASIVHLAKPLRAAYSILNWRRSWLSREILAVALFWGIVLLWAAASFAVVWQTASGENLVTLIPLAFDLDLAAVVLNLAAILTGIALLFVIGRAYHIHSRPSWNGGENYLELFAVALGAGLATGAFLATIKQPDIQVGAIVLGLMLSLLLMRLAHRSRMKRLTVLMAKEANLNAQLSLDNYRRLQPKVNVSLFIQGMAIIVALVCIFFSIEPYSMILWAIISLLEICAHLLARWVFYSLPVQIRHIPRWR